MIFYFFDRIKVDPKTDKGKTVLILAGAGGVGSMAIQLAKKVGGLTVIATASRSDSENWCKELGADYVVNHYNLKAELEKIMLNEILYIEGMRDYRRIHTTYKKIMTLQNFTELEQMIPAQFACRVHKSYMVAFHKIEAIERNRILIADQRIPISATYKASFFEKISGKF